MANEWLSEKEVVEMIKYTGEHCGSCHNDMVDGYGANEIEIKPNTFAEVCCDVASAFYKYEDQRR